MGGGVNEEVPLERDVAVGVGLGAGEVELYIGSFGGGGETGVGSPSEREVWSGATGAGCSVDGNRAGGGDCPTEEGGAADVTGAVHCEACCGRSSTDADVALRGDDEGGGRGCWCRGADGEERTIF